MELQKLDTGTAEYGVTKFSDMTRDEMRQQFTGFRPSEERPPRNETFAIDLNLGKIPDSWDWRKNGAVAEVKNQKNCGSCWAFATVANIEGVYAVKTKKLISLSEQELVDCDKRDGGCNGGDPPVAYKQIVQIGGMTTESSYPYKAKRGTCEIKRDPIAVKITGYENVPRDEDKIAAYLYQNGPLSACLNSSPMDHYKQGIIKVPTSNCNPKQSDHCITLVGYGVENGTPYWLGKNSWGANWGENGFFRMYRGNGLCGIDREVTSAKVN